MILDTERRLGQAAYAACGLPQPPSFALPSHVVCLHTHCVSYAICWSACQGLRQSLQAVCAMHPEHQACTGRMRGLRILQCSGCTPAGLACHASRAPGLQGGLTLGLRVLQSSGCTPAGLADHAARAPGLRGGLTLGLQVLQAAGHGLLQLVVLLPVPRVLAPRLLGRLLAPVPQFAAHGEALHMLCVLSGC